MSGVRISDGPLSDEVLDAYNARCRRERVEAGLPERCEDPEVLRLIADMVVNCQRMNGKHSPEKD
jgi:hypothetical protein